MARGLIDGPIRPINGNPVFYFRVRYKGRAADYACLHYSNMPNAFSAMKQCFPGADIFAIKETDFDTDGLPRLTARLHERPQQLDGRKPA